MDIRRTPSPDVAAINVFSIPFDELARFSLDGFGLIDATGKIAAWSEVAAVQTAVPAAEALGRNFADLFLNTDALIHSTHSPGTIQIGIAREKPTRWLRATALALKDGWLISFGPQRRHDRIEELKNELLGVISHELYTPIATIKAAAAVLRDTPSVERDQYLAAIDEQSDRLARAVDRLMQAARVDADQLPERRERVALDAVLDDALARLGADARLRRFRRQTNGVDVNADPNLLRDILTHLIENAMKFSASESVIEVSAATRNSCTIITVRDHGVGIEREHFPYIFERFYRVEDALTASTGGYGLGLYIVNGLVQAHGGTITVESELGVGSTFTIEIPEHR